MNRGMKSLIVLATFTLAVPMFAASPATSSITVSANVAAVCTITTTTQLDFGSYDPVVANASLPQPETAPAVVSVSCTKNSPGVYVDFANSAGTMTFGLDTLPFTLYTDSAHTIAFGSGSGLADLAFAGGKAAKTVSIYGLIPSNQDVKVGSYTGTVTARVNY